MSTNTDLGKITGYNRFSATGNTKEGGRGPLAALEDAQAANRLVFPTNLSEIGHYMIFRVSKEYKFRRRSLPVSDTAAFIYLPVPMNLSSGYGVSYTNESLGPVGELAGRATSGGFTGDGFSGGVGGVTSGGFLLNVGIAAASSEGAPLLAGLVGDALGGKAGALAGGAVTAGVGQAIPGVLAGLGVARNPHQALLFSGTDFRSHQFSFKFAPKNEAESDIVTNIITAFKYYMAPQISGDGHLFDYPNTFDIDFIDERHLFDIGESVLTDMSVNYHPEGTPAYFSNGAPTSVEIGLTFQEITITTKDEIAKLGR